MQKLPNKAPSTITLHFNNHSIELQTYNGKYRLNDLAELFSDASNQPVNNELACPSKLHGKPDVRNFTRSLTDFKKEHYEIESTSVRGKAGTYANELGVYWFAGKLDERFEATVYQAFKSLVHGEVDKAVSIANSLVTHAHEHMAMDKPRQRIKKLIKEDSRMIDEFVCAYIDAMSHNRKATYDDRMRTSESLRDAVEWFYSTLHARESHLAAACERALHLITSYQKKISIRNKTSQNNKLKDKLDSFYCANSNKFSMLDILK